jgi:hypothetical protein
VVYDLSAGVLVAIGHFRRSELAHRQGSSTIDFDASALLPAIFDAIVRPIAVILALRQILPKVSLLRFIHAGRF